MDYYYIWFFVTVFFFILILFAFMDNSSKTDNINDITAFTALVLLFIHIFWLLALMNLEIRLRKFMLPLWLLIFNIPILLVTVMVVISTVFVILYEEITNRDVSTIGKKVVKKREFWSKAKKDSHRKLNHVLIFIGLVVVWYVGLFIARSFTGSSTGMIPGENNMLSLYLKLIITPYSIMEVLFSLGWFYYLLFFFFYIFFLFMFANELTRKQKNLYFPFTFFTKLLLSEKETRNYGTYLFFTIGQLFAAFVCPPMVFFAILGIGSISDLMTSQIGIRYGKTHISWNKNKTWEGSIAGVIATFVIGFFFVGIVWSLIFTLAFLIFDIFTDKPINISDNLLIPIGCSLIYILIRFFFNLDYYTILLLWI